MLCEQALGLGAGIGGHVVADELERVECRAVFGDDSVEVLIPAERMRGHDRRVVATDDRQQILELDTRRNVVQVRQSIDQEMPLPRRDFRAAENPNPGACDASSASSPASH